MILLDLNQVMYSNLLVYVNKLKNTEINEDLLRHMILNSIRYNKVKFSRQFGELVICCDSKGSWRKTIYPYYKANRKKDRDALGLDWSQVINALENIRQEIKDNFSYTVVKVDTAEADDIIACIVLAQLKVKNNDDILILSGDKDFIQLHDNWRVKQYDPIRKKWISHDDPSLYLIEHIIRGDSVDGIPNMLSDDDCFVLKKRQKRISPSKLYKLKSDETINNIYGYKRNQQLIDLKYVPVTLKESIMTVFNKEYELSKSKNTDLLSYFMDKKLKNLMEYIDEF